MQKEELIEKIGEGFNIEELERVIDKEFGTSEFQYEVLNHTWFNLIRDFHETKEGEAFLLHFGKNKKSKKIDYLGMGNKQVEMYISI
jgi:hypothetical protein